MFWSANRGLKAYKQIGKASTNIGPPLVLQCGALRRPKAKSTFAPPHTFERQMRSVLSGALLLLLGGATASAQERQVVIPDGTEVFAVTADRLSSATAAEGDRIQLRVEEPVLVAGEVVIPKGAIVHGVVADVGRRGRMGRSGRINIRVESTVAVDGQRVSLRASKGGEGDGRVGTTVALTVLFGPLGLLKSGKDAVIAEGTQVKAYTNEAITVAVQGTNPAGTVAAPPTVTSLTGMWTGMVGARTITLSIIENAGTVTGSGDLSEPGQPVFPITVSGITSAADIALTLTGTTSRFYLSGQRQPTGEVQALLATAGAPDAAVTLRRR